MQKRTIIVKMGEMAVIKDSFDSEISLKMTLGSCIGVIFTDRKRGISGLSHVILPRKLKGDPSAGKYADTAIPELLHNMEQKGSSIEDIKAYLVGGATMFNAGISISDIGKQNYMAVKEILNRYKIPVVYEDVGGKNGKTVVFDHGRGNVSVKTLNIPGKDKTGVES